jgi:hypothetical protein
MDSSSVPLSQSPSLPPSSIDINDMKAWLIEMKGELQAIPLINRTYFENIRSNKLIRKIADIEAYIHINENENDYDGFMKKIPHPGVVCNNIYNNYTTRTLKTSYDAYKYTLVKYNKANKITT